MLQKISDFIKSELQSMLKNRQQSQKNFYKLMLQKISDFIAALIAKCKLQ